MKHLRPEYLNAPVFRPPTWALDHVWQTLAQPPRPPRGWVDFLFVPCGPGDRSQILLSPHTSDSRGIAILDFESSNPPSFRLDYPSCTGFVCLIAAHSQAQPVLTNDRQFIRACLILAREGALAHQLPQFAQLVCDAQNQ